MNELTPSIDTLPAISDENKSSWPWSVESISSEFVSPREHPWPKISIVTPSYNQCRSLEKTIRSVLLQGYPNLEYIICDGGSTDKSVGIIKKYEPWLSYWVSEKDRGQSHAINQGFNIATGELLGWLNSDDYLTEGALFKLATAYMENTSVGAIYGQGYIVDTQGRVVHKPNLKQVTYTGLFDWFSGHDFMQPSCLITRDAWLECGPLDESLHISLDVDLWIKIAEKYSFKRIEDLLSISLRHPGAKTTAMKNLMYVDFSIVAMRHGNEVKAREILESQANLLSELENKLNKLRRYRLLSNIYRKYLK